MAGLAVSLLFLPSLAAQPIGNSTVSVQVLNGATPPSANKFACWSSGLAATCSPGTVTSGIVGLVVIPGLSGGYSSVMQLGTGACVFDPPAPVTGHYVVLSTSTAGDCHDTGSTTFPVGAQAIGIVTSTTGGINYIFVLLNLANADLSGNIILSAGAGGPSSASSTPGGTGASLTAAAGTGGAATGTASNGGVGGPAIIQAGTGGASTAATGGAGGAVTIQGGAGGTGATAGAYGNVIVAPSGGAMVVNGNDPTLGLGVSLQSKLTVVSTATALAAGTAYNNPGFALNPNANGSFSLYDYGSHTAFLTGITQNGGLVGIGTLTPASLLSVGSTSQFQVNASGAVASVGGFPAVGLGVPPVVASPSRLTAQSGSIATATLCSTTACPTGLYEVFYYLVCTTTGSSGTVTLTIGWTDGSAVQHVSPVVSLTSLGSLAQGSVTVYSASMSSQAITYSTVDSGTGSTYALNLSVQKLQ